MDRYTKFANTWNSIGVTSRVSWHQRNTLDRLNAVLVKKLVERFGDDAKKIVAEISHNIGLEDGAKICENLKIDKDATRSGIIALETVALLSGVDYEITGDRKARQFPHLTMSSSSCVFGNAFDEIEPGVRDIVCENYTLGLIRAVSGDVEVKVLRKCCCGNKKCEIMVNFK